MQITPEALAEDFTLTTAATRLDFLARRDDGATTLNIVAELDSDDWSAALKRTTTQLDVAEALELLGLGEVISRKAHNSRLIGIRAALRGGAGWDDVAAALGITPQSAWDEFVDSVSHQLDADAASAARELAGTRPGQL